MKLRRLRRLRASESKRRKVLAIDRVEDEVKTEKQRESENERKGNRRLNEESEEGEPWADEEGELGKVYGYQMLNFNSQSINQLEAVISSLNNNKDSRRHIISLWNPSELEEMALPPCYLYFQFFVDTNDNLNMFVLQRSGDLFLGIPYDVALFSKLLLIHYKIGLILLVLRVVKLTYDIIFQYLLYFSTLFEYLQI